jgi:hypothetical protein
MVRNDSDPANNGRERIGKNDVTEAFERFERLTKRLLTVPKKEITENGRKASKPSRSGQHK